MVSINLRKYYPFYSHDVFVDVSDDLVEQMEKWERKERAYQRRKHLNKAQYSLDTSKGLDYIILFRVERPDEYYERKITYKQLHNALSTLSERQAKRIYAHCVLGISKAEIARTENVGRGRVGKSIASGLKNLETVMRNFAKNEGNNPVE